VPALGGSGYHHTLSDIRTHVRANLGETDNDNSFWDNEDHIDKYTNEVLYKLAALGIVSQKTYTTSIAAGEQTYTPQSDVWKITRIDLGDKRLEQIYEADIDAITGEDWDTTTREPRCWYWDGVYVRFDSVLSDAETVNVWYWAVPVELESSTDALSLDRIALPVIVDGICARACTADKDSERYQIFAMRYQQGIEDLLIHMQRRHESDPAIQHDTVRY